MADFEREKALSAERAVQEVCDDMLVGLGSGSTSAYAVSALGLRVAAGLKITGVPTSKATETLAREIGIPLRPMQDVARLDLTIDGADELTPGFWAMKGGGGALFREKVVATASDRMIVVVDSSKLVERLGRFRLPVEVVPYAAAAAKRALEELGVPITQRSILNSTFLTDQGNFIFDLAFGVIDDPEALAVRLATLPGVLDHGLFLTEVDAACVCRGETVEFLQRH